jgi:hypothetical protein
VSDISRFDGTIYTHTLPWALHGKDWCKKNLHTPILNKSLGNILDKRSTKGQENQTIGLPIGPDTSRILAEIIAVGIEKEFLKLSGSSPDKVFRYVDDWFIGYDGAGEAEDAIAFLSKACSIYELELNHEKTRIIEPNEPIDELWPAELRRYEISSSVNNQRRDIEHYFSKSMHYSRIHKNENVMDFALKKSRSFNISKPNFPIFESYILKTVRSSPITLPTAAQILINLKNQGQDISNQKVRKLINDTIITSALVGNHGELSWALFLAKGLRIKIEKSVIQHVLEVDSSICALITLDLKNMGLVPSSVSTSYWKKFMTQEALHSEMWLLAYEADFKNWLPSPKNHVDNHNYFKHLKSRGVYFYDTNKNVPTFSKSYIAAKKMKMIKPSNLHILNYFSNAVQKSI